VLTWVRRVRTRKTSLRFTGGTTHWISGTGKTFYDDASTPLRAAGIGLDVDDLLVARDAHSYLSAASREFYRVGK
jgi:hypothetical protein